MACQRIACFRTARHDNARSPNFHRSRAYKPTWLDSGAACLGSVGQGKAGLDQTTQRKVFNRSRDREPTRLDLAWQDAAWQDRTGHGITRSPNFPEAEIQANPVRLDAAGLDATQRGITRQRKVFNRSGEHKPTRLVPARQCGAGLDGATQRKELFT